MITVDQIFLHMFGDYVLQSHWMATNKTKSWRVALIHAVTYGVPFVFLNPSWPALAVIVFSHLVIDRLRLARYLVAFKNLLFAPDVERERLSMEIDMTTGSPKECPPYLAIWLLIIVDNLIHIFLNALALKYL
jgi:hypothetical protein